MRELREGGVRGVREWEGGGGGRAESGGVIM